MARGSSSKTRDSGTINTIPTEPVLSQPRPIDGVSLVRALQAQQTYRRQVEDNRLWTPAPFKPAKTISSQNHRLVLKPIKKLTRYKNLQNLSQTTVAFAEPNKLMVCIRRKIRKQIIFALGLNFKKGRGGKRKRNWKSSIRC